MSRSQAYLCLKENLNGKAVVSHFVKLWKLYKASNLPNGAVMMVSNLLKAVMMTVEFALGVPIWRSDTLVIGVPASFTPKLRAAFENDEFMVLSHPQPKIDAQYSLNPDDVKCEDVCVEYAEWSGCLFEITSSKSKLVLSNEVFLFIENITDPTLSDVIRQALIDTNLVRIELKSWMCE